MAISPRTAIVFNIAAVVVAASAVGAVVRSWVVKPSIAPCETRYTNVLAFRLDREGKALTAVDLQGRAGGRDIGLDHNVNIGPVPGTPKPLAMKVSLPAGSGVPEAAAARVGGMAFPWEPANIRPHAAACLAYNVLLSEPYDATHDGVLPGLQGAADDGAQRFVIGPAWLKNGDAGLSFGIALKPEPESTEPLKFETGVETVQTPLPKGRWLRLNQEVVLNTPDASDGIVRLWIDGKLVADRIDVRMRSDKAVVFTGVSARAHMLGEPHSPPAQADSSISLTPFELMW